MTGHRGPRRSRRASLLAATAVVAMAALTACGGSGSDSGKTTLTLTWWGDDSRAEKYEEAVALFEEQNPDIDVKTSFTDWDGYWTARSTEAAGKSLPDVMQFDLSYLREYSQSGQLLDLADYTDEQIDVAGMDENLVKAGEVDGAQLGVPVATNTLALFVNTTLAKKAGVEVPAADYTWDDLNKFTADVSAAGVKSESGKQVYGGGDYTGTMWFFMTWLKQQGIEPFGEDGSFNFGEEEVVEYLELTKDLRADKAVFPAARDVQVDPLDGFQAGEQASSLTWDNFLAAYDAEVGVENITMLPLPTGDDGKKEMFWKPGMLYSSGANTEHPEEAAKLISFLLNEPEVGKIFGTSQGVRADKEQRDAVQPEAGSVDAVVTEFEKTVTPDVTASTPVAIKGFGTIEAEWLRLAQELDYGNVTEKEFAEQWFAEAESATAE